MFMRAYLPLCAGDTTRLSMLYPRRAKTSAMRIRTPGLLFTSRLMLCWLERTPAGRKARLSAAAGEAVFAEPLIVPLIMLSVLARAAQKVSVFLG